MTGLKNKMRMRHLIGALAVALLGGTPAHAHHMDGTVHIYATGWGITLADDGTGFYSDLMRQLLGPHMSANNYVVYPYRRAMRSFLEDTGGCVYPKSIDSLYRTGDWGEKDRFIESAGILRSPIHIFTPAGKPVIAHDRDLPGKRIAYAMGSKMPYSVRVEGVTFVPIADEVDKAKLLGTGTVDAIVANLPDAIFVFESLKEPLPAYDPDYEPVPVPMIRIVCHDTADNRLFLREFNERVDEAVASGEMADFLGKAGIDDPKPYLPRP